MVNNISRTKFIGLVGSYKKGTHIVPKNEKLLSSQSAKTIDFRFPTTQSISIDGEITDIEKELHFEVMRGALRFVIPSGCSFTKEEAFENCAVAK
jgi:diacylglycerol kinase family enzyme